MSNRTEVGRAAEDRAAEFLLNLGYTLVTRRYKVRGGEIDLICLDGDVLVFVEVKFRENSPYLPEETIGQEKLKRMARVAKRYVAVNEETRPYRFDVIAMTTTEIRHHRHIFNH